MRRFESSGLAANAFCRSEGLALSSLQLWRQWLSSQGAAPIVELVPPAALAPASSTGLVARGEPAERRISPIPGIDDVLVVGAATDLGVRRAGRSEESINGLVALVQGVLRKDPLSGCVHVFFNRRGNYLKLVAWERTGYCLFAKNLHAQCTHTRRQFLMAEAIEPELTETALVYIRHRYEAEAILKPKLVDDTKRMELRAEPRTRGVRAQLR